MFPLISFAIDQMLFKLACTEDINNILDEFKFHHDDCKQILSEASLGGGKADVGFEQDRIGTLVSMATDSSHWVVMGKMLLAL